MQGALKHAAMVAAAMGLSVPGAQVVRHSFQNFGRAAAPRRRQRPPKAFRSYCKRYNHALSDYFNAKPRPTTKRDRRLRPLI